MIGLSSIQESHEEIDQRSGLYMLFIFICVRSGELNEPISNTIYHCGFIIRILFETGCGLPYVLIFFILSLLWLTATTKCAFLSIKGTTFL